MIRATLLLLAAFVLLLIGVGGTLLWVRGPAL